MTNHDHQSIRESIRRRIRSGEWPPGTMMPPEAILATENGCARSTVNRALRALADEGMIERKRRAGTRILELPVRRVQFELSLICKEIESTGAKYRPHILLKKVIIAPASIGPRLNLDNGAQALHLETVHLASGDPYAFEDRWVNIDAAPSILEAPLDTISANEWLIREVPYSSGDVTFAVERAGVREAKALKTDEREALFTIDRTTWNDNKFITAVKLYYRPGHKLRTTL